jgi:hypothetical protein
VGGEQKYNDAYGVTETAVKIFLSSSFGDLRSERKAVLMSLQRRKQSVAAMEYFLATPETPLETALTELRQSDVVLVIVGFYAGSMIPDNSTTYTLAEYEQARHDQQPILGFLKKAWKNKETSPDKIIALDRLKAGVDSLVTRVTFTTPDNLALAVIQSLDDWESKGRPGARKTFTTVAEYFGEGAPQFASQILDLSTTLVGRTDEVAALNTFLANLDRSVFVLSGRGGIGKSKLLHDWSKIANGWEVTVLKYRPLWHPESDKEIPVGSTVIIIDDAHRPEIEGDIANLVQLFGARRIRQRLKLLFSTRPGAASNFLRSLRRMIAESEIQEFPELTDLTALQAEKLAEEVLGPSHSANAKRLAQIAGRSPLVIVAGGRLIATGRVDLARLTNDTEFRKAVFDRFLDELRLKGPEFPFDPPRPLIDLIAALGPVDVQNEQFLLGAEEFLRATRDKILRTISELARRGILSREDGPVRILPDVLSDFILEDCCVGANGASTQFADRVYDVFGPFFFKQLIQNLAELDWRVGPREYGLSLLAGIWRRIEQEYLESDHYARRTLLADLFPAAFFQPERVFRFIEIARSQPAAEVEPALRGLLKSGKRYALSAAPRLLEATAHNLPFLQRSVDVLWELARHDDPSDNSDATARRTLKRLASYELNRWASFSFAMLLQCVRLCRKPGAFDLSFTPVDLIDQILEREGEFTEVEGNTFRFGGFELNYAVVGPTRQNAIDFLSSLIAEGNDRVAVRAIHSLEHLLHEYLTRVGRQRSQNELTWQNEERLYCLKILTGRLERIPISLPIRSEIYQAVRSGTGFHYTEPVRQACTALLPELERDNDLAVFDALSRREGDLPLVDKDNPAGSWEFQYRALIGEAHNLLEAIEEGKRADRLISFVKTAHAAGIETRGYAAILHSFSDDTEFIVALADQIIADEQSPQLINELAIALDAMHSYASQEFHIRARAALRSGSEHYVVAASSALRVYRENATVKDAALIRDFVGLSNPIVKRHALYAIAYMGGNRAILPKLLESVLTVDIGTDMTLADALTDAFGPYGVPFSLLTDETASALLGKFIPFEDFDLRQGTIPRFLNTIVGDFPDQVLELLFTRVQIEERGRAAGDWKYQALGMDFNAISFMSVPTERKRAMLNRCILALMPLKFSDHSLANIFWSIDPVGAECFHAIAESLENADPFQATRVKYLLQQSPRGAVYAYDELRKVGAELQPDSEAAAIIQGWCELSDQQLQLNNRAPRTD